MKIGLLAGTFDPPHSGHVEMANIALWSREVEAVWFLPCWQHAYKTSINSFVHRACMCYYTIKDMDNMYLCTDEAEIKSNNAIEIISTILSNNKDHEFRIIMGADNYWKMAQLKNTREIFELIPPIWINRSGYSRLPVPHLMCESTVSSTMVRNLLYKEKDTSKFLIKEVIKYINKENLYKKQEQLEE